MPPRVETLPEWLTASPQGVNPVEHTCVPGFGYTDRSGPKLATLSDTRTPVFRS
jgi:hypothetical protein